MTDTESKEAILGKLTKLWRTERSSISSKKDVAQEAVLGMLEIADSDGDAPEKVSQKAKLTFTAQVKKLWNRLQGYASLNLTKEERKQFKEIFKGNDALAKLLRKDPKYIPQIKEVLLHANQVDKFNSYAKYSDFMSAVVTACKKNGTTLQDLNMTDPSDLLNAYSKYLTFLQSDRTQIMNPKKDNKKKDFDDANHATQFLTYLFGKSINIPSRESILTDSQEQLGKKSSKQIVDPLGGLNGFGLPVSNTSPVAKFVKDDRKSLYTVKSPDTNARTHVGHNGKMLYPAGPIPKDPKQNQR
ncbi:MAG: hypothetical protein SFT68_00680 [Rickettsiaceae bacterium]|nr:hypothetical protein [Rickettsiaceae bacterium]